MSGHELTILDIKDTSLPEQVTCSRFVRSTLILTGQRHFTSCQRGACHFVLYDINHISAAYTTSLLSFSESSQARCDISSLTYCLDSCIGTSSISGVACLLHVGSAFVHVAVAPCRSFSVTWAQHNPIYLCRSPWASPVQSLCWLAHAASFTRQWHISYLETPRPTLSSRQPSRTARPQRRGQASPWTLCGRCQTGRPAPVATSWQPLSPQSASGEASACMAVAAVLIC